MCRSQKALQLTCKQLESTQGYQVNENPHASQAPSNRLQVRQGYQANRDPHAPWTTWNKGREVEGHLDIRDEDDSSTEEEEDKEEEQDDDDDKKYHRHKVIKTKAWYVASDLSESAASEEQRCNNIFRPSMATICSTGFRVLCPKGFSLGLIQNKIVWVCGIFLGCTEESSGTVKPVSQICD